jgi:hypothetical protein
MFAQYDPIEGDVGVSPAYSDTLSCPSDAVYDGSICPFTIIQSRAEFGEECDLF